MCTCSGVLILTKLWGRAINYCALLCKRTCPSTPLFASCQQSCHQRPRTPIYVNYVTASLHHKKGEKFQFMPFSSWQPLLLILHITCLSTHQLVDSSFKIFLLPWKSKLRPLKVELHRSTASTMSFTQSPSFSNNPNIFFRTILNNESFKDNHMLKIWV